jgi:large subunit ribosomal protein L7e
MLQKLGLHKLHQAVFLKLTPENKALLALIEPYVIYGYPNINTVREVIYKYGFIRYKGRKSPIKSNTMIEEIFKDSSVICVEDIIHEISTVGEKFDLVNSMLCPFVLPNPQEGWIGMKGVRYQKGGIAGYRGEEINNLLKTIL